MNYWTVYYLLDPTTQAVRWVGSTNDPKRRLANHVILGRLHLTSNVAFNEWIAGLRPQRPILVKKCVVATKDEAVRIEAHLTKHLRSNRMLFNISDGHDQQLSTRAKTSAWWTPERRAAKSKAVKTQGAQGSADPTAWTLAKRLAQGQRMTARDPEQCNYGVHRADPTLRKYLQRLCGGRS